jgi:hypothetical protein
MLSSKYFNDAITMGLVDVLASSIDVAVRAMGGSDPTATLFTSSAIPASNIAEVLRSPNITGDAVQSILYRMTDNKQYDRVIELMTTIQPDQTFSASTTLTTGVNFFRNVSIASGVTLTLGASPCLLVADTISNSGTITTNVVKGAGGVPGGSAGAGGPGRHGIIILARSLTTGTIRADGGAGVNGTAGTTSGSGGAGGGGLFWEISGYPAGTGGTGGGPSGYTAAGSKNAGGGGAGFAAGTAIAGGPGGSASVVTYSTPLSLSTDLFKSVIDTWITSVLGKSLTTPRAVPALGGSGGGGGGAYLSSNGGGGGGGGGQILVYGTTITAGTITAVGGSGGNGAGGGFPGGGGGGGGGIIYVFYKSLSGTFSFSVAGGAGGTGSYTGTAGTAGSAATFAV